MSEEFAVAQDVSVLDSAGQSQSADESLSDEPTSEITPETLVAILEAILFVTDGPVSAVTLATSLDRPVDDVVAALGLITAQYDERQAGMVLQEVAGGYRFFTRETVAGEVEAYLRDGQRTRLSQAGLETLAVVAYKQPVTRARIAAIRGVNVDGVVRTLLSRGLITEVGTDPDTAGGLYGTTELFMEKMGLRSLDELPSLAPLLPELDTLDSDVL
jgi:segregation and condensation protein B